MVRVLLVDDERDFADILAERLRTRGLEADTAYDGRQALEHIRAGAPDVVVLDITMPGMSGLETLEALKGIAPRTEVILLTADTTVATAVTGMKLGAGDYLIKPADIDTVVTAIGEAETRRMARMSRQRMAEAGKLAALGELGKGVAHEINNPVHIMVNEAGLIEDLLDDVDMDPDTAVEIKASLDQIRTQARRCKAITSKLLTLRPAPAGQAPASTLPEVLRRVVALRQARMAALGVNIALHWDKTVLGYLVRESEWEQVLANLVDNALDAMEHTGGTLDISGLAAGEDLQLSIGDNGCGMEARIMTRIFEPFFSTKEVGKGIGLGLAICHGVVEAMGGSITVRSTPGHGSVFTIKAPMSVHARNEHTAPDSPALSKEES